MKYEFRRVKTYIFSHRNIAVPSNFEVEGCELLWELEGKQLARLQCRLLHARTRSDKTLTWLDGRVAVNRLAVSTSEHMFVLRRSKISFLVYSSNAED
jgi:hypothetical protein